MSSQSSSSGGRNNDSRSHKRSRRAREAARQATREVLLAGLVRDGRILACRAHHDCVEQVVRRLQSADTLAVPTLPRGLMVTFWASLMCRDCDRASGQAFAAAGATGASESRRSSRAGTHAGMLAGGWLRPESQLWLGDSGASGDAASDGGVDAPRLSALRGGRAARAALYLVRPTAHAERDDLGHDLDHDLDRDADAGDERDEPAAEPFALFSPIGDAFERGRCTSVRRIAIEARAACRVTLPVDEWICVLLQGALDVTVEGARPARLDATGGRPQLLWLPALPAVAPGLPPIALQALDGPVRGMALLFRADGVDLARDARHAPVDWRPDRAAAWWRAASERHPRLRDGQPFVSPLDRLAHGDRPALFEPRACFERSSAFELAVTDFPASSGPRRDGDLTLSRREGWRELIIPLRGRVRYALATSDRDASPADGHRLSQLARGGRSLDLGSLASVAMRPRGLPDLLVFDGTLFHGFAPAGRDGASLLRIRGPA